jgi:ABC-type uncharacterized transport system substrate-binding protein
MRRRDFMFILGGVTAMPFAARGQQGPLRKVGYLGANTPETAGHLVNAFVARLAQLGWIAGKNLAIEYRWAAGETAKFRELTDELIAAGAEVIVTSGNAPALAAARATTTIPIVLAASGDIVSAGLVKSLSHPGGNVTGLTFVPEDTVGKRLELLKEVVPGVSRIAVLYNPDANPEQVAALRELPERAEINALFVVSDPLVFVNRIAINQFALRERLPTVHMLREYAVDGGLLAYGPHFPDFFSRAADFVDKILRGTKPEDLPVERATIFRMVVNLRTAKALGLAIPETFLLRADEVIE